MDFEKPEYDIKIYQIDTTHYEKLLTQKAMLETFTIEKVPPLFPRIEEELIPCGCSFAFWCGTRFGGLFCH